MQACVWSTHEVCWLPKRWPWHSRTSPDETDVNFILFFSRASCNKSHHSGSSPTCNLIIDMSDGVTGTDPGMRACGRPGEAAWLARVRRIAEVRGLSIAHWSTLGSWMKAVRSLSGSHCQLSRTVARDKCGQKRRCRSVVAVLWRKKAWRTLCSAVALPLFHKNMILRRRVAILLWVFDALLVCRDCVNFIWFSQTAVGAILYIRTWCVSSRCCSLDSSRYKESNRPRKGEFWSAKWNT